MTINPAGEFPSQYSVQDIQRIYQGQQIGPFQYAAGVSGTRVIVGKVQSILAHSAAGGSFTIDGGDSIPVPANVGFAFSPCGNLMNTTLIFTNTDMYFVEIAG